MDILEKIDISKGQEAQLQDFFKEINNYKEFLPISKVIKFFELKNVILTKTMIQNYSKIGILPPLVEKRYYSKNHLICIYLIYSLKNNFSLEEIGQLISKIDSTTDLLFLFEKYIEMKEKLSVLKKEFVENTCKILKEGEHNDFIERLVFMDNVSYMKAISTSFD